MNSWDTATISAFTAYSSSGVSSGGGITFEDETYDLNGDYDNSTGEFTAPRDGVYVFSWGGMENPSNTVGRMVLQINDGTGWNYLVPGDHTPYQARIDGSGDYGYASLTLAVPLDKGNRVRVYLVAGGIYPKYGWFSGFEAGRLR